MQDEVFTFLTKLAPFSILPEAELKQIRESVSAEYYSIGHNLAVQGRTKLDYIYLIKDGSESMRSAFEKEEAESRREHAVVFSLGLIISLLTSVFIFKRITKYI